MNAQYRGSGRINRSFPRKQGGAGHSRYGETAMQTHGSKKGHDNQENLSSLPSLEYRA